MTKSIIRTLCIVACFFVAIPSMGASCHIHTIEAAILGIETSTRGRVPCYDASDEARNAALGYAFGLRGEQVDQYEESVDEEFAETLIIAEQEYGHLIEAGITPERAVVMRELGDFGVKNVYEAITGGDIYGSELTSAERFGRFAMGSAELVTFAVPAAKGIVAASEKAGTKLASSKLIQQARNLAKPKPAAAASVPVRTNAQLVQDIATRAEVWGTRQGLGNGAAAGTLKHGYAERMLRRYQQMFGNRGLTPEARFFDGAPWRRGIDPLRESIRLDVVEGPLDNPTWVWDYKFGNSPLTPARISEIQTGAGLGPTVPVEAVRP